MANGKRENAINVVWRGVGKERGFVGGGAGLIKLLVKVNLK